MSITPSIPLKTARVGLEQGSILSGNFPLTGSLSAEINSLVNRKAHGEVAFNFSNKQEMEKRRAKLAVPPERLYA
jgi:hypothetical protein